MRASLRTTSGRGLLATSWLALASACGSRTGLAGGIAVTTIDAGVVRDVASEDADARADGPDGDATNDTPFACGNLECASSKEQYCLTTTPGCDLPGQHCVTSVECCTSECIDGFCSSGSGEDAGSGAISSCAALPSDCRTSTLTCACLAAHQPCGGGDPVACSVSGGVASVTCLGF